MFFARSFLIASAIGGALAQISGVSTECQSTILGVAANSESDCLNPSGLLQVFLAGSSSVVTPVDTWLKGLCSRGPCSNNNIADIVTNITTGCATDLKSALGDTQPGSLTPIIQEIYPTVRKGVCLADASNNNQLCITQTLTSIQSTSGTLTLNSLLQIVPAIATGQTGSINGTNLCTPCIKQIYNVAKSDFPAIFGQGTIASDVQSDCGASFVDGASDPNIVETASNSSSTSGSSSSSNDGCGQTTGQQALLSTFFLSLLALTV